MRLVARRILEENKLTPTNEVNKMANTCSYTARIRGKKQNVIDFLWWLVRFGPLIYIDKVQVNVHAVENDENSPLIRITRDLEKGKWENGYVGRIGHWDAAAISQQNKNGEMLVEIEDWCAWSFLSTGIENSYSDDNFGDCKSVPELCRIYDIQFELFSEETGNGFDEYYFFDGRNEEGDRNEDFDHDVVISEMEEEWTVDYDNDICWKWVKENGKRHKEKRDKDEVFFETKNRLFPHEFRELSGDEWDYTHHETGLHLDEFCKENLNSWGIPWETYTKKNED